MRGVDDGPDGLNDAAFDRALGATPKRRGSVRSSEARAATAKLEALKDDWRAGRGDICAGTFSHTEQEPERDHFDLYMNRDGALVAYATSMELHRRYVTTYGRPTGRWCYEVPAHVTEVIR